MLAQRRRLDAQDAQHTLRIARELLEAVARKLPAEVIARHVLDLVRFVEHDGGIFGQDRAEIVLADGEIGEKEMVVDDDQVRFMSPLVHRGDEAALEFRALLPGAEVAARVDAIPKLGVVGKERQLAAITRFGQLLPVAYLREPVDLVDSFQNRLALHLMDLVPAKEICAALHQGRFQIRREMLLQEGNVLLEELLLKRFGSGRNDHASAAANRGHQVGERLSGARAGFHTTC